MPDKNIYILRVQSGSRYLINLFEWIYKRKNADGILLITSNNEEYFEHFSSREREKLTITQDNAAGSSLINKDTLIWANRKLIEISKKNPNWIIVDGIGNSEVRGQGLFESITEIIQKAKRFNKINILFVIPDELVDIFITYYDIDIKNGKVITLAELMKLKHG
jgi:hypothetical protein